MRSNKFLLAALRFITIDHKNLMGCNSEAIPVRFLFSILITLIFNGLKIGKVFKSNTCLLILDPEVA